MRRDSHREGYSLEDLLALLSSERGDCIRLQVGLQPILIVRGRDQKIDGPLVEDKDVDSLIRSIAGTRRVRALRETGSVDLVHTFRGCNFLLRLTSAFGMRGIDVHALRS